MTVVKVGNYIIKKKIGHGAFAEVRLAVDATTGEEFAVKIFDHTALPKHQFEQSIKREIRIMQYLRHPNIVSIQSVLVTPKRLYLFMELVRGGELYDEIVKHQCIDEHTSRRYFQQIVDAMVYCHRRGVVHRDLKPENLLLDCNGNIKITDFGMASMRADIVASLSGNVDGNCNQVERKLNSATMTTSGTIMTYDENEQTKQLLRTQCGTPKYMAPEIIIAPREGYDGKKLDAWDCGMILYALLAGYLPFYGSDDAAVFRAIINTRLRFPKHFSDGACDLLTRLLQKDPEKRESLEEIRNHPWFLQDYQGSDVQSRRKLLSSVSPKTSEGSGHCRKLQNNGAGNNGANNTLTCVSPSSITHSQSTISTTPYTPSHHSSSIPICATDDSIISIADPKTLNISENNHINNSTTIPQTPRKIKKNHISPDISTINMGTNNKNIGHGYPSLPNKPNFTANCPVKPPNLIPPANKERMNYKDRNLSHATSPTTKVDESGFGIPRNTMNDGRVKINSKRDSSGLRHKGFKPSRATPQFGIGGNSTGVSELHKKLMDESFALQEKTPGTSRSSHRITVNTTPRMTGHAVPIGGLDDHDGWFKATKHEKCTTDDKIENVSKRGVGSGHKEKKRSSLSTTGGGVNHNGDAKKMVMKRGGDTAARCENLRMKNHNKRGDDVDCSKPPFTQKGGMSPSSVKGSANNRKLGIGLPSLTDSSDSPRKRGNKFRSSLPPLTACITENGENDFINDESCVAPWPRSARSRLKGMLSPRGRKKGPASIAGLAEGGASDVEESAHGSSPRYRGDASESGHNAGATSSLFGGCILASHKSRRKAPLLRKKNSTERGKTSGQGNKDGADLDMNLEETTKSECTSVCGKIANDDDSEWLKESSCWFGNAEAPIGVGLANTFAVQGKNEKISEAQEMDEAQSFKSMSLRKVGNWLQKKG